MDAHDRGSLWAVVLAGGRGKRLAPLTRALYGYDLPKQFASFTDRWSLLQHTVLRIAPITDPERTVIVVAQSYEDLARRQLRGFRGVDVAVQPHDRGTGPGILLPLARVQARDPNAIVAIFPTDHYVPRPEHFLSAVRRATRVVADGLQALVLLGAAPDHAETEYGWILPGRRVGSMSDIELYRVRRFVEKPDGELAQRLLTDGALWNTFVIVGRAKRIWALSKKFLPECTRLFGGYQEVLGGSNDTDWLHSIYERLPDTNFSKAVLQRSSDLTVIPVRNSGWTDWGSPERVIRTMQEETADCRQGVAVRAASLA